MATSYPRPDGGDKHQNVPKNLVILVIISILLLVIAAGYVMSHRHDRAGQPADTVSGPQVGAEGTANNVNGRAVAPGVTTGNRQGGGPGAMGSGMGVGQSAPGAVGTRSGGASSGPPAGPGAGSPGAH